jgi:hypothetical protein
MTLKGIVTGLVTIGALASSSVAFAADTVRAGEALPGTGAVTTDHLPTRAVMTMHRKEHLQGEAAGGAAAGSAGWVLPVLGIAAIGGGIAAAVSNTDSKPDSP